MGLQGVAGEPEAWACPSGAARGTLAPGVPRAFPSSGAVSQARAILAESPPASPSTPKLSALAAGGQEEI